MIELRVDAMPTTSDVELDDGRTLQVHDTGPTDGLTVIWHHGSPQTGALLDPLVSAAAARNVRLISYARPSYGGSTPRPGRDVASAAGDVESIADSLDIDRFAVMGASGGGPHALACAALLPDRVVGVVCLASLAPLSADIDWYAGMVAPGGLHAAYKGRDDRADFAETDEFDPESFIAADWATLEGDWESLAVDAGRADADGPDGLIDDDVAFVHPWGFDVARIAAPVLLVHGSLDRVVPISHSQWLLHACRSTELWVWPRDSHVSILPATAVAMDWLIAHA